MRRTSARNLNNNIAWETVNNCVVTESGRLNAVFTAAQVNAIRTGKSVIAVLRGLWDGGACGDNVNWYLDRDGHLAIYGSGAMQDYSDGNAPWTPSAVKTVTIGSGVTAIGDNAFASCTNLTEATIAATVTSIGDEAFYRCLRLTDTNIEIDSQLASIGNRAFYLCARLGSASIFKTITHIGNGAFAGCANLASITVDGENPNYSSVSGVLFNKDQTTLLTYPGGRSATSYSVPDTVTQIAGDAFSYSSHLTDVTIPNGVSTINSRTFAVCTKLKSITIPQSVTAIQSYAFQVCSVLNDIYYGGSLAQWKNVAVSSGSDLTQVTIHCTEINANLSLPAGTTSIESEAFAGIPDGLVVHIPASVTQIASDAFSGVTGLTIYGTPGTAAETFAKNHGYTFATK